MKIYSADVSKVSSTIDSKLHNYLKYRLQVMQISRIVAKNMEYLIKPATHIEKGESFRNETSTQS